MKTTLALQARHWILLLLVPVIVFIFFMDLKMLAWQATSLIHQGFLAVYIDAASFVSGCF